jgi:hypothetical protein
MSFHISSKRPQILVRALDDWDRELGRVLFNIGDDNELDPQDLEVSEKNRSQGVAKKMYDFVKSKGYSIHRSSDQTDAGAGFWNKHRGEETIWEDTVDEMALPTDWDPTALGHDKSFKSRLEYALQRARRLGGGSARVAFIIEDNGRPTVLKIAKNRKGLVQNQAEADILDDGYIGKLDIVIPLVDYDKTSREPVWIQTELAQKIREPGLCKMLKCKSLTQLIGYTNYLIGGINGDKWKTVPTVLENNGFSEQDIETFKEYASELGDLVSSSGALIVDFQHASNWGIYNGRPVIIDVGYTEAVKPMYMRE